MQSYVNTKLLYHQNICVPIFLLQISAHECTKTRDMSYMQRNYVPNITDIVTWQDYTSCPWRVYLRPEYRVRWHVNISPPNAVQWLAKPPWLLGCIEYCIAAWVTLVHRHFIYYIIIIVLGGGGAWRQMWSNKCYIYILYLYIFLVGLVWAWCGMEVGWRWVIWDNTCLGTMSSLGLWPQDDIVPSALH